MFMLGGQGQKMRRERYRWVQREKRRNQGSGVIVGLSRAESPAKGQHEAGRAGAERKSCG